MSLRRTHAILQEIISKISNDVTIGKASLDKKWKLDSNKISSAKGKEKALKEIEFTYKELGYERDGKLKINTTSVGEFIPNESGKDCSAANFNYVDLRINSPIAFGCRQSYVKMEYAQLPKPEELKKETSNSTDIPGEPPKTKLVQIEPISVGRIAKKPPIDVMKRIIMKTLSECYYFKKLEEDSPLAFGSLREKLRYFHPAFHSTTPEGLNARLTFLQQCIRPGDTIPLKGIADDTDLNARNTSFGPPPICVLRIGDFYHSKVIIRDVNITFDDNVWDLNPEGIGVQPMIANVSLQINFIGGQGLKEPISRLQNALSSNFYANTEMYDERSESTNEKINGQDAKTFTKEFLTELYEKSKTTNNKADDINGKGIQEGKYIGEYVKTDSTNTIEYKTLITKIFDKVKDYFETYQKTYNIIVKEYGTKIASLYFSPTYRSIKDLTVQTSESGTEDVELLGVYPSGKEMPVLMRGFKAALDAKVETVDFVSILNFDRILPNSIEANANKLLKKKFKDVLNND